MNKQKIGFTLGEVLICIMIIGIIMALSIQTIKLVKSSYTSLAYFALKNIQTMVGETYAGKITGEKGDGIRSVILCRKTDGTSTYVLKPDNYQQKNNVIPNCNALVFGDSNNSAVCEKFIDISNTAGRTRCDSLFKAVVSDTGEPEISDLKVDSPTFITSNGFRYYLTNNQYNPSISTEYGFRLLAVDLNGKKSPNISKKTGTKAVDIVTFLIMDNGEIFPVGVAADNIKFGDKTIQYLNSKLKGYYYSFDAERTENIPQECFLKDQQSCNYAVVYISNTEGLSFFSYREAYCKSLGGKQSVYKSYCNGITGHIQCPPSSNDKRFDLCLVENVKPMFRYNFNR